MSKFVLIIFLIIFAALIYTLNSKCEIHYTLEDCISYYITEEFNLNVN